MQKTENNYPLNKRGVGTGNKSNDDENTFDVPVAVHSTIKSSAGGSEIMEDLPELPKGLKKISSTLGSSFVRNASSRVKLVSKELRKLASLKSQQLPHEKIGRFDRTKLSAAHSFKGLQFLSKTDAAGWADVENRFYKNATADGLLPRAKFGVCMGMSEKESDEFDGKLYDVLARRKNITSDSINITQLKEFWEQLVADQSFDSRLQTFFDMADKDGDGRLTKEEVSEIIKLSASANSLSQIRNQADEYAAMIMEACDPQKLGYIMIWDLELLLLHALTDQSEKGVESQILSQMLSQKLEATVDPNPIVILYKYLLHNWQRIWVVLLWVATMAGLFAWKYVQYKEKAAYKVMGPCVCFAKGAAETLKLNMAITLLPVCRNTITWLRNNTKIGSAVALDDSLNFHKMIAVAITLGVAIHGLAHLTCDFPRLLNSSKEEYEPMKYYFGDQPRSYGWFIKDVEGVTGISMVVLMAIAFALATPWFRRGKAFNAFWYCHHLFVIVYSLLIVHGIKLYLIKSWYNKTTWMYLAVPITLYAGERLLRSFRSRIKAVQILEVAVYHDNLLALHMSKPQRYKYKSGQYMFVNCAAVSPFEWHPFSISSAPGDDYLSVHIRAIGDWTKEIKEVFKAVCTPDEQGILRAYNLQGENNPNLPRVLIDGPYGASLQDYKKYEVVLLVCLGIGVTPMISILKDIMNNVKAREEEEKSLENGDGSMSPNCCPIIPPIKSCSGSEESFNTRKAYFYWVTKQDTFVWFNGKLNEIVEMDHTGIIEMHNHCSSVYKDGDAHSALITTLQFLHQAKKGDDILSGTRIKSHFGRPDWQKVYKRIACNNPDAKSVGVFTCGATPKLTKELDRQALDISHKTSIEFDFHKENF